MSDVTCPYCGAEQEINHDDGYGYEEGEEFEQECGSCEETFRLTTTIWFHYDVECQEEDHDMSPVGKKFPNFFGCSRCSFVELRRDHQDKQDAVF